MYDQTRKVSFVKQFSFPEAFFIIIVKKKEKGGALLGIGGKNSSSHQFQRDQQRHKAADWIDDFSHLVFLISSHELIVVCPHLASMSAPL